MSNVKMKPLLFPLGFMVLLEPILLPMGSQVRTALLPSLYECVFICKLDCFCEAGRKDKSSPFPSVQFILKPPNSMQQMGEVALPFIKDASITMFSVGIMEIGGEHTDLTVSVVMEMHF